MFKIVIVHRKALVSMAITSLMCCGHYIIDVLGLRDSQVNKLRSRSSHKCWALIVDVLKLRGVRVWWGVELRVLTIVIVDIIWMLSVSRSRIQKNATLFKIVIVVKKALVNKIKIESIVLCKVVFWKQAGAIVAITSLMCRGHHIIDVLVVEYFIYIGCYLCGLSF